MLGLSYQMDQGYALSKINKYRNAFGQISPKYASQFKSAGKVVRGLSRAAWGIGWEAGRAITNTSWYQEAKFNFYYNYWESKVGAPSQANENLWFYFFLFY